MFLLAQRTLGRKMTLVYNIELLSTPLVKDWFDYFLTDLFEALTDPLLSDPDFEDTQALLNERKKGKGKQLNENSS